MSVFVVFLPAVVDELTVTPCADHFSHPQHVKSLQIVLCRSGRNRYSWVYKYRDVQKVQLQVCVQTCLKKRHKPGLYETEHSPYFSLVLRLLPFVLGHCAAVYKENLIFIRVCTFRLIFDVTLLYWVAKSDRRVMQDEKGRDEMETKP